MVATRAVRPGAAILLCAWAMPAFGQSSATLRGSISDANGAPVRRAVVTIQAETTAAPRTAITDNEGRYLIAALPAGRYRASIRAAGFQTRDVTALLIHAGTTIVLDFELTVSGFTERIDVTATPPVDRGMAIAQVMPTELVHSLPLNGRQFVDLGLLAAGAVTATQTGFSSVASRGQGALAFNIAGNREESVAFVINGLATNNLTFGSLGFSPPVDGIHEFKIDTSTFHAEFGHVSGAVVNIVTRSGGNRMSGELSAFVRDDALDARNYFEFGQAQPNPFSRLQAGGYLGGPILKGRTFFFAATEVIRLRQGLQMNSLVLSDAERAAVTSPIARRLVELVPPANYVDSGGTSRFLGAADATVDNDRSSLDVRHRFSGGSQLHGFYGAQQIDSIEPIAAGNTIPGFGHRLETPRSVLTLAWTHLVSASTMTELRAGVSRFAGSVTPNARLNPIEFGIRNGLDSPLGLPQIAVAGGLNFGGPANYPQGRDDLSVVVLSSTTHQHGRHALSLGGEYRHFTNDNFVEGRGSFNFPTVAAFQSGVANAFAVTLGRRTSHIVQQAMGLFVQDHLAVSARLSMNLGVRYEWHVTPTERDGRFVVFDAASASLRRVGVDVARVHRQNNANVEPRAGVAWDPGGDGRTLVRAAFAVAVDQPSTTAVSGTTGNPPFAVPLMAEGAVRLGTALDMASQSGFTLQTIDPGFRNASLRSWNVNVRRQIGRDVTIAAGYVGSRGRHLRLTRNLNQPAAGVRPYAALSADSPLFPGSALGNIMQVESTGRSSYRALWLSVSRRLSRAWAFSSSYTFGRSLDTNSLNSSGFAIQDSNDVDAQWGPSDFDVRHRFAGSATMILPFTANALVRGWQVAAIVQAQTGSPVNIVTGTSAINGLPNTVRPDVTGPIRVIGDVDRWFDTSVFAGAGGFGNLPRNAVRGPAFVNADVSITRTVRLGDRSRLQLRADVFDVFNRANLGQPGNVVGTPTFGKITRTRFPTGEAGSSRQVQLAVLLGF